MASIGWAVRRCPVMGTDGSVGEFEAKIILVPSTAAVAPGRSRRARRRRRALAVKAKGRTPTGALLKAANLAAKLASNPVLSAVLPPGTGLAIKATQFLAKNALKGKLGKAMKLLRGKGAKRLGKALKKFKFW